MDRVSASTANPYAVNNASRAIVLLGDLLSMRIGELDEKRLALDDPSGENSGGVLEDEITALELEGHSARQEVDRKAMRGNGRKIGLPKGKAKEACCKATA